MIQLFVSLDAMRQQLRPDARVHGIITKGGDQANIIPEHTASEFYLRAPTKDYCRELLRRFEAAAEGAAIATGCTAKVTADAIIHDPLKANFAMAELFSRNLERIDFPVDPDDGEAGYGSTDCGNVSQALPTIHPYIRICPDGVPGHSREFAEWAKSPLARTGMVAAAKALAMTALDLLAEPDAAAEGEGRVREGLVEADREAGPEVRGVRLALEQPAPDARVEAAAQEAVLPVELGAIGQRHRHPRAEPHVLEPVGVAPEARRQRGGPGRAQGRARAQRDVGAQEPVEQVAVRREGQPQRRLARNLADRQAQIGDQVQRRLRRIGGLRRPRPHRDAQQQRPDSESPPAAHIVKSTRRDGRVNLPREPGHDAATPRRGRRAWPM